jgi:hypothetical protein
MSQLKRSASSAAGKPQIPSLDMLSGIMRSAGEQLQKQQLSQHMQRQSQQQQTTHMKKGMLERSISDPTIGLDFIDTSSFHNENSASSFPDTPRSASSRNSTSSPFSRSCSPSLFFGATNAKQFTQQISKELGEESRMYYPPSSSPTSYSKKPGDNRLWYLPKDATIKVYSHTYLNGGAACLPKPEVLPVNRAVWTEFRRVSVVLNSNDNCVNAEAEAEYRMFAELDFPADFPRPKRAFIKRMLRAFQTSLAALYINTPFVIFNSQKFKAMQGSHETRFFPTESPNMHIIVRNLNVDQAIMCTVRLIIIEQLHIEFNHDYPFLDWSKIFDYQPYKPKKPHLRQNFSSKCSVCESCAGQKLKGRCANSECCSGLVYDRSFYKVTGVMNEKGQFYSKNISAELEDDVECMEEGFAETTVYRETDQNVNGYSKTERIGKMTCYKFTLEQLFYKMRPQKPVVMTNQFNIHYPTYPNYVFELEQTNICIETAQRILTPITISSDAPSPFDEKGNLVHPGGTNVDASGKIVTYQSGKYGNVKKFPIPVDDERVQTIIKYWRTLEPKLWSKAKVRKAFRCETVDKDKIEYEAFHLYTDCRNCKNRRVNVATGLPMHKSKCISIYATPVHLYQKCVGDEPTENCLNGACGHGRSHAKYDSVQMPNYLSVFKVRKLVRRSSDVQVWYKNMKAASSDISNTMKSDPTVYDVKAEHSTEMMDIVKCEGGSAHTLEHQDTEMKDVENSSGVPNCTAKFESGTASSGVPMKAKIESERERCRRAIKHAEEVMQRAFKKSKIAHTSAGNKLMRDAESSKTSKHILRHGLLSGLIPATAHNKNVPVASIDVATAIASTSKAHSFKSDGSSTVGKKRKKQDTPAL